MTEAPPRLTVEDAQIIFRNFSGRPTPLNPVGGKRTFNVLVGMEQAAELTELGWNVKIREPKEEGDEPFAHLPCEVRFDPKPPRITMITSAGDVLVGEDTIELLDVADIRAVDVVLNPYVWSMPDGKGGIKAYVKTMIVYVDEDELERKLSQKMSGRPAAVLDADEE